MSEAPTVLLPVASVNVRRGETLTVWLDGLDSKSLQVELRVTLAGAPEVFVADGLDARRFSEWIAQGGEHE